MVEVARFARQHGLSKAQTDLVVFLVGEHLEMSQFAQKEDLSDPDVILRFVEKVKTPRAFASLVFIDRRRHSRHQSQSVERVERQIIGGLYRGRHACIRGQ